MPLRLVAFLLFCALSWADFGTRELPAAWAAAERAAEPVLLEAAGEEAASASSLDGDPRLDNLPGHADLGEPAVLPAAPAVATATLATPPPRRPGMADIRSTALDGLLRPPCSLPRHA